MIMNKSILIRGMAAVLLTVCIFAGCRGNESSPENVSENPSEAVSVPSDSLTGQWQSEQLSDYIYTFNDDGTGRYDMAGKILELKYTTDDGRITISFQEEGYTPVTLEYILDGDRLNIKDSFGKDTFYERVTG